MRAPEAPREAQCVRRPPLESAGSGILQTPSRGEGRLACRASWDRELPGWILRPRLTLTGGLNDGIGAGA
eukprot:6451636-Alexandrium_andersonii.AAC.1